MSGTKLRVAIAQMEVVAGQPRKNLETMKRFVDLAKQQQADLVVFPEFCLSGRYLGNRWHDAAFIGDIAYFDDEVLALSDGIGIIFGNASDIYCNVPDLPAGEIESYFSEARFCRNGAWVPFEKSCDCDDDCDCGDDCHGGDECDCDDDCQCHESPYYMFECDGREVRIAICLGDLSGAGYSISGVMKEFACMADDCDIIFDLCSSPWSLHAMDQDVEYEELDERAEDEFDDEFYDDTPLPPIVRVNCVGMQNTDKAILCFDGASTVYGDGYRSFACRDDFQEDFLLFELDLQTGDMSSYSEFTRPFYDDVDEKVLDGIIWGLRRFDEQVFPFHPKWVIGLSGGLDSSVTAALMCQAFGGPERIVGYNLATRYNSDTTKMNAYDLAQALGIRLVNGSIEQLVQATDNVVSLYGYPDGATDGLVQENIQARLRGHLLSTFAAIEGGVIMNNGNKVEATFGYATLYGDAVGAISPIGDITKVRLFNIARLLNKRFGKTVIPENLLPVETVDGYTWETMPSAELKDAQKDPMKWFYHDWIVEHLVDDPDFTIETLLAAYRADKLESSPVGKWVPFYGLDDAKAFIEDVEWIERQVNNSVFKRVQMPPTIAVVRDTAGFDYRENQMKCEHTHRYEQLKAAILNNARR